MRFEKIRAKGLGPFRNEINVDLTALPGMLVAVTGENGAGKSTLLELLAGGLFRACPTRGSLASLATARDAFVEVQAVNGAAYTFRQSVDAVSQKGEALVLDAGGAPVLPDTKVAAFDKWAAKHLPPPEVLFASTFAAQGSGGFLDMRAGERKGVLLRVLGIERYEQLANEAREQLRAARTELATATARLGDERSRAGTPVVIEAELAQLREDLEKARAVLTSSKEYLDRAEAQARTYEAAAAERRNAVARREEIVRRHAEAGYKREDLRKKVANNRAALENETKIRAAAARVVEIDRLDAELATKLATAQGDRTVAENNAVAAQRRASQALRDLEQAKKRVERAGAATKLLEQYVAIAEVEKEKRATVESALERVRSLEESESIRQKEVQSAWQTRVSFLRDGLEEVIAEPLGRTESISVLAARTIAEDNVLAEKQADGPRDIANLRTAVQNARTALDAARRELAATEKQIADLEMQRPLAADLEPARAEVVRLEKDAADAEREAQEAYARGSSVSSDVDSFVRERRTLNEERGSLAADAKTLEHLDRAAGRLAELEPQLAQVEEDLANFAAQLNAFSMPPEPTPVATVNQRAQVEIDQREVNRLDAAVSVKEAQLADAQRSAARIEELEQAVRRIEADVADWTLLADSLGRDGLQSVEIDSAGPELTSLANELLHSCSGPRFTITVETTRLSSDGKRQLEGLDVRVIDTQRGRDALAETLSGGERVVIGEALSLALSVLSCRRHDLRGVTLVRDESGAALDPENARAYIRMLRKAAEFVDAQRVLLVSHSADVADMCDAKLRVANGSVEVVAA